MTNTAAAALAATLSANLSEIEAAIPTAEGYIMAWPGGLGVRWVNGDPLVCGVLHAARITDASMTLTLINGKGEAAQLIERKAALTAAAASIRETLSHLDALAA